MGGRDFWHRTQPPHARKNLQYKGKLKDHYDSVIY